MSNRFTLLFKSLRQVGLTQALLYALYKVGLFTGYYRFVEKRVEAKGYSPISLFPLPSRTELFQVLGEDGQRALLTEADEIVAGKIRLFGAEPEEMKLTFDQLLHHWTAYETGKIPLSSLVFPQTDIKFIWEPARFGWAYILGRAYHLSGDETYPEAFWSYFERFDQANPPYLGPHWMNGQEVALRLMALVWAGQVFASYGDDSPYEDRETAASPSAKRRARLARSIVQHAARIPPTLIYARAQNNNHLITEAAALYTAGRLLGHTEWRVLGWHWLNRALQHQISPYGEYIQHSVNYHRLMLQTALWVNAIKDTDWPPRTFRALGRATHWLFSLLDPASGRTPNLGANDGALILPLSVTPFHDYRPTVQAAARAFLRYQMPGGVWDEMALWLGLGAHEKAYDSSSYLSDHLRGRESWTYLRATTFPSRLGHMDQLHLDLWWRGLNVAQDPGTYLYNAPSPWDNPLVTARVHNTVTVDGRDPMTRGGRFLTLNWFPAYASRSIVPDEDVLGQAVASHNGYRSVRHERIVTVYKNERWRIEDRLLSKRPHTYRLHWLLPDWKWKIESKEQRVEIGLESPQGTIVLILHTQPLFPPLHSLLSLVRCGEVIFGQRDVQPYEGWSSPTYGTKVPALSLALHVSAPQGMTFISEFLFPGQ